MNKLPDGTLLVPIPIELMTSSSPAKPSLATMTVEEMRARISLLSSEIDANEEENRFMQREIDQLYTLIDDKKE